MSDGDLFFYFSDINNMTPVNSAGVPIELYASLDRSESNSLLGSSGKIGSKGHVK